MKSTSLKADLLQCRAGFLKTEEESRSHLHQQLQQQLKAHEQQQRQQHIIAEQQQKQRQQHYTKTEQQQQVEASNPFSQSTQKLLQRLQKQRHKVQGVEDQHQPSPSPPPLEQQEQQLEQQPPQQKQQQQQKGDKEPDTTEVEAEEQQQQQTALDWLLGDHADAAGGFSLEAEETEARQSQGRPSVHPPAAASLDFRGLGHELNASELHQLIERYSWNQGNTQLVLAVLAAGLMPNLVHVEYNESVLAGMEKRHKKGKLKDYLVKSLKKLEHMIVAASPRDGGVQPHRSSVAFRSWPLER